MFDNILTDDDETSINKYIGIQKDNYTIVQLNLIQGIRYTHLDND